MSYTPLLTVARQGRWMLEISQTNAGTGELRCIGATTDEYRYRKDAALERRFQQVFVAQPTVETTISLRGLKQRYEVHHSVKITDSALVAAFLSSYISDRFCQIKQLT